MQITGTRFGEIDVDAKKIVSLRSGLIGFPDETRFVLLRPKTNLPVSWLQSLKTPLLAFPVVESTHITPNYPDATDELLAGKAGLGKLDVSVLVIVSVRPKAPRILANLLAPIVVDRASGHGAQVVLDSRRYGTSTPLSPMPSTK
jgi:flagellar assembly factor FliW